MWRMKSRIHLVLCLAVVPPRSTLVCCKRKTGNSSREDKCLPQSPLLCPLVSTACQDVSAGCLPTSHPCYPTCCVTGCWRQADRQAAACPAVWWKGGHGGGWVVAVAGSVGGTGMHQHWLERQEMHDSSQWGWEWASTIFTPAFLSPPKHNFLNH